VANGSITERKLAAGAVTPTKLSGVPTVRAYNSAAQVIADSTGTTLGFDSERWDVGSMHNVFVNNGRLNAPIAGVYDVTANVTWAATPTGGSRATALIKVPLLGSPVPVARQTVDAAGWPSTTEQTISTQVLLPAGAAIRLSVRQSSGATLAVLNSPEVSPEIAMTWIVPG